MLKRSATSSSRSPSSAPLAAASGPATATSTPQGNAFAQSMMEASAPESGGILDPWLLESSAEQGVSTGDQAELGTGEGASGTGPATVVTEQMVDDFNSNFAPVIHGLGGTGDGGRVTAEDMQGLFTADQLGKLRSFLASGTVPPRMFNGVQCTSAMTSQRRILLSSHILNTGTFDPSTILEEAGPQPEAEQSASGTEPAPPSGGAGSSDGGTATEAPAQEEEQSEEREIAANSCRHWAMMVYGYAGLPVPGEGADGLWHTHDATGGINLGGTAPDQTEGGFNSAGGMARGTEDGDWAPYFGDGVSAASIFQPGDWLQLAWSSGGGHSVVLTRVVRENRRAYWIDYYSQTRNGLDSARRLDSDKRISKRIGGGTVVFSHRPMSQAQDPQSAGELFSGLHEQGDDGALRSASPNQRFIQSHAPGEQPVEEGPVTRWLCEELVRINRERLDELGDRLTDQQRAMMDRMNIVGDGGMGAIEQLVRVNQRMVHTLENDAHTRFNAAQEDTASPQYRVGRYGGRGNGNYGVWEEIDEDGIPRARSDKASVREINRVSAQRTSGELADMPDNDRINWNACPAAAAPAAT